MITYSDQATADKFSVGSPNPSRVVSHSPKCGQAARTPASWAWVLASCFAWPHAAYWLARRSADPFQAELRNLMFDSIIAGLWAPLLHFNALPSVLLMSMATADKVNSGIRGLWLRSLPAMALGLVGAGLLTGFAFEPETTMPVVLACLPIMVIHTLAVSLNSFMLVRRVQLQNRQLDELSRVDVLTGRAAHTSVSA